MTRVVDALAAGLLLAAALAFWVGIRAVERQEDRVAVYWLAVGALCLKGSTDLVHPRSAP